MKKLFYLLFVVFIFGCNTNKEMIIFSPDNKIQVFISTENNELTYSIKKNEKSVIKTSRLGIILEEGIDLTKKFKIVNSITPISISLFANSSIVEKKKSNYLSYRSKVWQNTSRGGLPKLFLENLDFEKYADFIMNFPILFIQDQENYI